jgi:hypothetical protein
MPSDSKSKTQKTSAKRVLWKKALTIVFVCLGLFSFLLTGNASASDLIIENPNWASVNDIQVDFGGTSQVCSSLNCGPYSIPDGTAVTLGDVSDANNPVTFTKGTTNETVRGNFTKQLFNLTTSQVGDGTVTSSTSYVFDQSLPVSAVPDPGWQFDYWIGDTTNLVDPNAAIQ